MALLAYDSADWATPPADSDDMAHGTSATTIAYARVASTLRGLDDRSDAPDAGDDAADEEIWRRVVDHLAALRLAGRHALRVVEVGCGCGDWLLRTVARARATGFTAIEGLGIDPSVESIAVARQRATILADPAIGVTFTVAELYDLLEKEAEDPADLILCLDTTLNIVPPQRRREVARELTAAGAHLIARARSSDGDAIRHVAAIGPACAAVCDAAHDRLEIDMPDGVHISLPWHGFAADEVIALFASCDDVPGAFIDVIDNARGDLLIEVATERRA